MTTDNVFNDGSATTLIAITYNLTIMGGRSTTQADDEGELLPIIILIVSVIIGGYMIWERPGGIDAPYIWLGFLALSVGGVIYVAWGFNQVKDEEGVHAAVSWLFSELDDGKTGSTSSKSTTEKTPPPSERLKNEIRLDRAEGQCEYCGEETNLLDVHHIKPRSKGGPNTRKNLIALCGSCHKEADNSVISRSALRHKVRQHEAQQEV